MSNSYFQFKQFTIHQDRCAMKVTTDGCLFGAWLAERVGSRESGVGSPESLVMSPEPVNWKILDVGTGTGLLPLMIAQKNEFFIDAIEIDKDAFEQASDNIAASPWKDRIKVFHADIQEAEFTRKYDVIISNPPFYENELKGNNTRKNLAHHDAGLLLPDLLSIIKKNLKPGGTFYLLLPYKRSEEIKKLIIGNNFSIEQMVFVRQSVQHDYFRAMLTGKLKTDNHIETRIDETSIKDEKRLYTPSFINLLQDYYLHL